MNVEELVNDYLRGNRDIDAFSDTEATTVWMQILRSDGSNWSMTQAQQDALSKYLKCLPLINPGKLRNTADELGLKGVLAMFETDNIVTCAAVFRMVFGINLGECSLICASVIGNGPVQGERTPNLNKVTRELEDIFENSRRQS